MKKLLIGMVLLGSIALAEPMPEGTPQYEALEVFRVESGSFTVECPPERDPPTVQTFCLFYQSSSEGFMPAFDASLEGTGNFAFLGAAWAKDPFENRYVREYALAGGGTLRAIFDPTNNQATVFYIP